jgi:glucosamine-6-phosphate deaminase
LTLDVFVSAEALARALAQDIARALAARPSSVLGLPAGRTPVALYRELSRLHSHGRIDFSRATIFGLDEFLGVAGDDPRSFESLVRGHLLNQVNVNARHVHFLNGLATDPAGECERYERAIARAGGIDLQVLGLGANGHIGFNEPSDRLIADTHRVTLTAGTRRANAATFDGRARAVPKRALSMGVGTILRARRIVLVATGVTKARGVARLVSGAVTPRFPASLLQTSAAAELWLDRDAARAIPSNVLRRLRRSRRARSRARGADAPGPAGGSSRPSA